MEPAEDPPDERRQPVAGCTGDHAAMEPTENRSDDPARCVGPTLRPARNGADQGLAGDNPG